MRMRNKAVLWLKFLNMARPIVRAKRVKFFFVIPEIPILLSEKSETAILFSVTRDEDTTFTTLL